MRALVLYLACGALYAAWAARLVNKNRASADPKIRRESAEIDQAVQSSPAVLPVMFVVLALIWPPMVLAELVRVTLRSTARGLRSLAARLEERGANR